MRKLFLVFLASALAGCSSSLPPQNEARCVSLSFDSGAPQSVCYSDIGGNAVYQGDIVLGKIADLEAPISERGALISGGAYLQAHTWAGGVIPYTIEAGLPDAGRIDTAISRYHALTKIRFVPRSSQRDFVTFRRNGAGACSSMIGRAGEQQFIELSDLCSTGNTIHEMAHAAGLWHEQSRNDRDNYVSIFWGNIMPGQEHNFSQSPQLAQDHGAYDFNSIMHYVPTAFSKNGQPTITRKDGSTNFGQQRDLSDGDVRAVASLYGTVLPPIGTGWLNGVAHAIAAGPAKGAAAINVWNAANGQLVASVNPFAGFGGGVTVALGDINGDGVLDIVAGAGPGAASHVMVFSGANGQPIRSFYAHDPSFPGGIYVAAGDINHDGADDIITGVISLGGPHVKVFDGRSGAVIASFFAYDAAFRGGVRVASGDIDGDGYAEIITGAGPGAGTDVRAYKINGGSPSLLTAFFAYDSGFKGGILVGAGDLDNDGRADIVTGAGPGAGPHVAGRRSFDSAYLASFFAYSPQFAGGVNVAATVFAGQPAIVSGPATASSQVCAFNTGGGIFWCSSLSAGAIGAFVAGR